MTTYRIIAMNDTESWNLPDKFQGKVKIYSRYLYNPSEHTYCCELTPSRELHFLGSEWAYNNEGIEFSDDEVEQLYEILLEGDTQTDNSTYMWNMKADKLPYYEVNEEDEDKKDEIDRACEYARGNVQLPNFAQSN